ncbi:MAG: hypothetical protein RL220_639 [Bacteroidota bacterium]
MLNTEADIYLVPITVASLLLVVAVSIFGFFALYRRKQQLFARDKENLSREFQNMLLRSQIEISEQTMQNISQEIHDNIGQRLTLAAMQLNNPEQARIKSSRELINEALRDLRSISKNLSGKSILENGLELAIEREVSLINSGGISCEFTCHGDSGPLSEQEEVVLFRCVQEALHNALRHSGATRIIVNMIQNSQDLSVSVSDNGRGFPPEKIHSGQGLSNMGDRMKILGGVLDISNDNGTTVNLRIHQRI